MNAAAMPRKRSPARTTMGWQRSGAKGPARKWRARSKRVSFTVSLAPMIDMTFTMLIFFVVTTRFERAEGVLSSELPRESTPSVALPVSPIVVRLAPAGADPNAVSIQIDRFANRPANMEELVGFLIQIQQEPGFDAQTPVVLVADNAVPWDAVVGCWNAALRAGCKRIAFAEP